jgi:hypothetical protein
VRRLPGGTIAAATLALVALVLGGLALWPRARLDSDYFGPNMPTWVRVPTVRGDPVYVGVLRLSAQAGDVIELTSLDIERREGDAKVEPMLRILNGRTETLGGIAASALPDTFDLSTYLPLPGFRFADADGPVEFSLRVGGTSALQGFDGLWLGFTRNGDRAILEDWIPMRASICTGSTLEEAVERCRPIEAESHSFGL